MYVLYIFNTPDQNLMLAIAICYATPVQSASYLSFQNYYSRYAICSYVYI